MIRLNVPNLASRVLDEEFASHEHLRPISFKIYGGAKMEKALNHLLNANHELLVISAASRLLEITIANLLNQFCSGKMFEIEFTKPQHNSNRLSVTSTTGRLIHASSSFGGLTLDEGLVKTSNRTFYSLSNIKSIKIVEE